MIKIAINGFGRIGRMIARALMERQTQDVEVVAINDLASLKTNLHLLQWDSIHGPLTKPVTHGEGWIDFGFGKTKVFCEKDPRNLNWKELEVEVVLECSGVFTARDKAAIHLEQGAKRVLISAPAEGADATVVYGVNHTSLNSHHQIISNASCTTNCLAPVASVLHQVIGIASGYMTTIHAYTNDQNIQDSPHKDLARARAAMMSMIPTSTGAARAVGLVLPELKGKLDGTAIRVPVANVSMIDFVFKGLRKTTVEEINTAIVNASQQAVLKGVLSTNALPLVSVDFNHNPASAIFDLNQTQLVGEDLCRVLAWYDNEWGFSNRMVDMLPVLHAL